MNYVNKSVYTSQVNQFVYIVKRIGYTMIMSPKTSSSTPISKRESIVEHAYAIFYKHGFHATGVDTVLANSGISKRTLYKYFRSKEALIAAVVTHYHTLIFKTIPASLAKRSSNPKEQILSLFDLKSETLAAGDFSGCFAINAKLEFIGKDEAIETACRHFFTLLEAYVMSLCEQAHCKNPAAIARQIMILFEGSLVLGQIHHDPSIPTTAREMAKNLLICYPNG